jgi:hypothetical protein
MIRTLRTAAVALSLMLGSAMPSTWAQGTSSAENNANQAGVPQTQTMGQEESGGGGDPLYGYVGTAFLCAGALFVICKSARR